MNKKLTPKIKLNRKSLRDGTAGAFDASTLRAPFTVYVTNKSNWKIICWSLAKDGPWHQLNPPIGRTCTSSCRDCWSNGNYAPVHSFSNDAEFDIYLVAERGGQYLYLDPAHITPTSDALGMSVCVDLNH
jgi:hypothetical protein